MPVLKNARHERFAQLVASGKTQADAYRVAYPVSVRWKDESVHEKASKLAAKVRPRVDELLAASAEKITITKAKAVNLLAEALMASPKDVNSDSKFAQEMVVNPVTGQVTIRLPSKIAAFDALAKVFGWYAPQKVDGEFRFKPDGPVFDRLRQAAEGK